MLNLIHHGYLFSVIKLKYTLGWKRMICGVLVFLYKTDSKINC